MSYQQRKKGQTHPTLFDVIIIILSFLVILPVTTRLYAGTKEGLREMGCYSMMIKRTIGSFEYGFLAFKNDLEVFCPEYIITFNDEDYSARRGTDDTKTTNYPKKKISEEAVNKIIAKEIVECWEKFGGGSLDAFYIPRDLKYWAWDWDPIFSNEDKIIGCRTCAVISFDLTTYETFTGLINYMKETSVGGSKSDDKKIYGEIAEHEEQCSDDYIGGENCWEEFAKNNENAFINTQLNFENNPLKGNQKDYFVVFVREGLRKGGTLNTYVMDVDTKNALCVDTLPFRVSE
ncbi:MAG: hypothetical protein KKF89_05225 [Nanoarchaeota archaeon]|nr:hypothetical protein [Nanoarchaeota archaeon]MBU1855096.1 hypothetical protein [Nanoarchaeota archaeon]